MKKTLTIFLLLVPLLPLAAQKADTVKTKQKVIAWMLNEDSGILPASRDTNVAGFEVFDPAYLYYRYPIKTGNIVAPAFSASFVEWPERTDDFFLRYYKPYIFNPGKQVYYRARTPFTQGTYTSAGQKINQEQILDVIHTQNINREWNAGLVMNFLSGEGQYNFQKQKKNTFGFFTSYLGKKYALFGHISVNKIYEQENGGIKDKEFLETSKPKDVPVKLGFENKAWTLLKNMNFQILNYYAFGKFSSKKDSTTALSDEPQLPQGWGRLSYRLKYENTSHSYTDHDPLSGFYRNVYYDSILTYDTAWYRTWENEVALELRSNPEKKFSLGSRFGLRNEMQKYAENGKTDTIIHSHSASTGDTAITNIHNHYIGNTAIFGEIFNNIGKRFQWKVQGSLYLFGYKSGNTEIHGKMQKIIGEEQKPVYFDLYGDFTLKRPVYRLNHFSSNHFIWDNDFKFIKDLTGGISLRSPVRHAGMQLQITLLSQYVYFDSLALPEQFDGSIVLYNLELNKDFYLWKFSFQNHLCLQQTSEPGILPLPLINFRNSTAFNHTFHFKSTGGMLQMQLGLDLFYQTPWYGYAYMPATGQFYVQQKTKIGNYPFMDAYLNMKVQRVRLFFKLQHFSSMLFGPHYFTVVNYPMNQLFFKFGVSWTFYD